MTTDQVRLPLSRRRTIRDTLQLMARVVRQRKDDRRVRDIALRVTESCPRLDMKCRMAKVLDFARRTVRYEFDPVGIELIHDPVDTLARIDGDGLAAGDCDDGAVLVSAMLESIGVRTRLTAVSVRQDRRLHHVAVEARDPSGFWIYLDPFLRGKTGPPRFTRLMRVPV